MSDEQNQNQQVLDLPILLIKPGRNHIYLGRFIGWTVVGSDDLVFYDPSKYFMPWEVVSERGAGSKGRSIFQVSVSQSEVHGPSEGWTQPKPLILTAPEMGALGKLEINRFLEDSIQHIMTSKPDRVIKVEGKEISLWKTIVEGKEDPPLDLYVTLEKTAFGWGDEECWKNIFDWHHNAISEASRDLTGKLTTTISS